MVTLVKSIPTGMTTGGVSTTTVVVTLRVLAPEAALALKVTVELCADEATMPDRLQVQVADCAPTRLAGEAAQPLTPIPAGKP
jgi:hypothetical protein